MGFEISPLAQAAAKEQLLKKRHRWMGFDDSALLERSASMLSSDSNCSVTSNFGKDNDFSEESEYSDEDSDYDIGFSSEEIEDADNSFLVSSNKTGVTDQSSRDKKYDDSRYTGGYFNRSEVANDANDANETGGIFTQISVTSENANLGHRVIPDPQPSVTPSTVTTLDNLSELQLARIAKSYTVHKTAVLGGKLLVTRSEVCLLAALQTQIEFGAFVTSAMLDLKLVLPAAYTLEKGIRDQIFETQRQFKEISDTKARVLYVAACRQSPLYKCRTHFVVSEKVRGKTKLCSKILGITAAQLLIIDPMHLSIMNAYELRSIRRWNTATVAKRPSITFEMHQNASDLRFFTPECVAISSSIAAHLSQNRMTTGSTNARSVHVSTWRDSISLASFSGADSAYGGSRGSTPQGGTPVGTTPEVQRRMMLPTPTSPLATEGVRLSSELPVPGRPAAGAARKKRWSRFLSPSLSPRDADDTTR
eukprot:m.190818 g.190818  ORF g.190818 m.190818 type:complete len:478 (+) comp18574_c0_seq1:122-1555(+)